MLNGNTLLIENPAVRQAWMNLEMATAELESAEKAVHWNERHKREIGLPRLSLAQQAWDRANAEMDRVVKL